MILYEYLWHKEKGKFGIKEHEVADKPKTLPLDTGRLLGVGNLSARKDDLDTFFSPSDSNPYWHMVSLDGNKAGEFLESVIEKHESIEKEHKDKAEIQFDLAKKAHMAYVEQL